MAISKFRKKWVHDALLLWFHAKGRKLPWRRTKDPYAILVSEIMLQQTQVSRVLPKYRQFLVQFPTISDLARAPLSRVLRSWSGLGYNRRAKYLWETARQIEKNGKFPRTYSGILSLPGVGINTASAVLSFAFQKPFPVLDVNAKRVLSRVFTGKQRDKNISEKKWLSIAKAYLPKGRERQYFWNQALMDIGALLCTDKTPRCVSCPLISGCLFGQQYIKGGISEEKKIAGRRKKPLPFMKTRRYVRGQILLMLTKLPDAVSFEVGELKKKIRLNSSQKQTFFQVVEDLIKEGLVEKTKESPLMIRLPEYD